MALTYVSFANTPCSIVRQFSSEVGDTTALLRVGNEDATPPATTAAGNVVNVPFFEKLKAACRQLAGVDTDEELSGVSIPSQYLMYQAGENMEAVEAALQALFPNGSLLSAPFIESISTILGTTQSDRTYAIGYVDFQDNGDLAPAYADFRVGLINGAAVVYHIGIIIKLFHSLTT